MQQLYFRTNDGNISFQIQQWVNYEIIQRSDEIVMNTLACRDDFGDYTDIKSKNNSVIGHLSISSDDTMSDKLFFLEKRLIDWVKSINCLFADSIDVWSSHLNTLKASFVKSVISSFNQVYYSSVSEVVTGLTLGKQGTNGSVNYHLFKVTGTLHLISISGFHLSFFMRIVRKIYLLSFSKRTVFFLNLLFSWLFVCLVGSSPGIIRAFLLFFVSSIALLQNKQKRALYLLINIFVLSIMTDLKVFFNIGFQLSYAATFGILLFSSLFKSMVPSIESLTIGSPRVFHRISDYFYTSIIISLSAQLAIFPLVAYHFKEFSVISIVSTLLVMWLIPLIMNQSFVLILFSFILPFRIFQIVSVPLFFITQLLLDILEHLSFSWSAVVFSTFSFSSVIYSYLLIGLVYSSILCIKIFLNRQNYEKVYHFNF